MIINGKDISMCGLVDLNVLLNNEEYKESDYIDYKKDFAFFELQDRNQVQKKKAELRHDICSFANSKGGTILFGITESKGVAREILGVDIDNIEAYENRLKDIVSKIEPFVPQYTLHFLRIAEDKYVVVLKVDEGIYKPYVNQDSHSFKFYLRRGSGKVNMNYEEVKRMYNSSLDFARQVSEFRDRRIEMAINNEGVASKMNSRAYALIHFIPESAFSNKDILGSIGGWRNQSEKYIHSFPQNFGWNARPNVDGLSHDDSHVVNEDSSYLQLFVNGIVEKFMPIKVKENSYKKEQLVLGLAIKNMRTLICEALVYYKNIEYSQPLYIQISLIGAKGIYSEYDSWADNVGMVDRTIVKCMAFEIRNYLDSDSNNELIDNILIDFCYSVGIREVKKFVGDN